MQAIKDLMPRPKFLFFGHPTEVSTRIIKTDLMKM